MRVRPWLVIGVLGAWVCEAGAVPPRKTGNAHVRPKSAAPPADENPYGATEPGAPAPVTGTTDAAPTAKVEPSTGQAPAPPGDAKLDTPPPPQVATTEGPKPSPLNPEPPESPKSTPLAAPASLEQLVSEIVALRARVAALATSLFSSKLRIYVRAEGDDARVQGFEVTLDDGVVFHSGPGFTAEDEKVVYEHAVAPGNHVVGIQIERLDARGTAFKTWQTTRFAIQVPERKTLEAIVVVEDGSDMGKDFPDDQDGKYDLGVRLRAKVAP